MVKTKHQNTSRKYHSSRTRTTLSRLSLTKKRDRKIFSAAKRAIIIIIILATITVACVILITSLSNPKQTIENKLTSIATDYYENYFYPGIVTNNPATPSAIFAKYQDTGFTRVPLRQLLLFDGERHAEAAAIFSTYCDLDGTFVQFFPESPFGKTDYRVDYHYACTFE